MDAHEQARAVVEPAILANLGFDPDGPAHIGSAMMENYLVVADAVSDFWKAREERTMTVLQATVDLLRDLLNAADYLADQANSSVYDDVIERAREALDDDPS